MLSPQYNNPTEKSTDLTNVIMHTFKFKAILIEITYLH